LPNQKSYATGSYAGDIRLNGRGTHGASGQPVQDGMIAAPKTYAFGTKIALDGLGTMTVLDRGGAIVKAGQRGYEHDRIDIWMGKGDAGLTQSLRFGKQKVNGCIL
jgi:3D (Asp-Asp-Asp) domain-containing protein